MQVDPIKPKLTPLGSKRLKLKCDVPLSNIAFKSNLRRCIQPNESIYLRINSKVRRCRLNR
jgi:hypothetical protein